MRPLLLLPLTALFACATEPAAPVTEPASPAAPTAEAEHPTPAAPSGLDLGRWIEDALALSEVEDYEARQARARTLTEELDTVAGWKAACGEDVGAEAGAGLYLAPLGDDGYLAEVTCFLGPYQSTFTLVHVTPEAAALLRLPAYDETGALADPAAATLTGLVVDDEPADRQFAVFAKSAGHGGCGVWTRYEVGENAEAEALEVRARDCSPEHAGEPPPPEAWPVVYAAE